MPRNIVARFTKRPFRQGTRKDRMRNTTVRAPRGRIKLFQRSLGNMSANIIHWVHVQNPEMMKMMKLNWKPAAPPLG
jgi:hypothetical protein